MITIELTKTDLLPQESAIKTFMEKMNVAEKSILEQGFFSEAEVEEELAKI